MLRKLLSRKLLPVVAAGAVLVGGLSAYSATEAFASDVTLTVDGRETSVRTLAPTVGQVLAQERITVGDHDTVVPSLASKVERGSAISVRYGRPVTVTVDGKQTTMWTTATTVDEALGLFGVDGGAAVNASRSMSIGRDGISLDVSSPREVTVTADGATASVTATGTVADALRAAGVTLGTHDEVAPDLSTPLDAATTVTVVRVEIRTVSKSVTIPYRTTTQNVATLPAGARKVQTPGVNGTSTETWQQTVRDGQVSSEVRVSSVVTAAAQAQVTLVGTGAAVSPAPAASAATAPASGNSCGVSWYATGTRTADGEAFNPDGMTAASKTLPFNTMVKVTNPANGLSVVVRINDRGPYVAGRCLDLTRGAFSQIASLGTGAITATWQVVG
ncbi:MAG: septal ring lytic transglycosylase RlpA family protein [Propionibacteriaceae bacterium]